MNYKIKSSVVINGDLKINGTFVIPNESLNISTDENNALVINEGLYVKDTKKPVPAISTEADNILTNKEDGLYVSSTDVGEVTVSKDANNSVEMKADGLYSPVPEYKIKSGKNALSNDNGLYAKKYDTIPYTVSQEVDNILIEKDDGLYCSTVYTDVSISQKTGNIIKDDNGLFAQQSPQKISSEVNNRLYNNSGLFADIIVPKEPLKLSTEDGNQLVEKTDGLYVSVQAETPISTDEGNIIKMESDGLYANVGSASVSISEMTDNTLELLDNGLYSSSVVDVKVSTKDGNIVNLNSDGLYVPPSNSQETNTTVLNPISNLASDVLGFNKGQQIINDVGSLTYMEYSGAVYANEKLYFIPNNSKTLPIMDVNTREIVNMESFNDESSSSKWYGGVRALNGKIYCAPLTHKSILVIDPSNDTYELVGSFEGSAKWCSGVLGSNGKVYFIPFDSMQILEINPDTHETKLFGSLPGSRKWNGGVAFENKIYFIPHLSTQLMELNVDTQQTTNRITVPDSRSGKWRSGCLLPNNKILCSPFHYKDYLIYDPVKNSIDYKTTTLIPNGYLFANTILGTDGNAYSIPQNSTVIMKYSYTDNSITEIPLVSKQTGFVGAAIDDKGTLYCTGYNEKRVLILHIGLGEYKWAISPYYNKC